MRLSEEDKKWYASKGTFEGMEARARLFATAIERMGLTGERLAGALLTFYLMMGINGVTGEDVGPTPEAACEWIEMMEGGTTTDKSQ